MSAELESETRTSWQGRLALTAHTEPPERLSAAFSLEGRPEAGSLTLHTPLGNSVARLQWQPGSATLEREQRTEHYASLDALLARFAPGLPVAALFDWLAGRDHAVPGWEVDLREAARGRIAAQRWEPAPRVELRLVLD